MSERLLPRALLMNYGNHYPIASQPEDCAPLVVHEAVSGKLIVHNAALLAILDFPIDTISV